MAGGGACGVWRKLGLLRAWLAAGHTGIPSRVWCGGAVGAGVSAGEEHTNSADTVAPECPWRTAPETPASTGPVGARTPDAQWCDTCV